MNYLLVALGSALGGIARYWITVTVLPVTPAGFPTGTLMVNLAGSLLIGVVAALITHLGKGAASVAQLFVMIGILGGFTTFSSFSLQTVNLLDNGHVGWAIAYMLMSVTGCVVAAAIGYWAFHNTGG